MDELSVDSETAALLTVIVIGGITIPPLILRGISRVLWWLLETGDD